MTLRQANGNILITYGKNHDQRKENNMEYKKAQSIRLRDLGKDEKWLQDRINDDPSILGLGDLAVFKRERIQSSGGRIDFVLYDPEDDSIRYEAEIMLGVLNESHIIRTIEYWDIERTRYPTLEHRAVIVAEEITNRFFNVISLMNKAIPIIAIQLNAFVVENNLVLNFVKVLDMVDVGNEEEEIQEVTDRKYWESRANPASIAIFDELIKILKSVAEPKLTYNKGHIAVGTAGRHFMWCHPRKGSNLFLVIRVGEENRDELVKKYEEQGIECEKGARRVNSIKVRLTTKEFEQNRSLVQETIFTAEKFSH